MSETSVGDPKLSQGKSENMFARAIKKIPSAIFRKSSPNLALEPPLLEEPPVPQELYPSPDRLRVSQKLLFHTMPLDHLDSVINKGLFSVEPSKDVGQQTMGENLAYSLYFPIEREADRRRIDSSQIPGSTLDNYALTIWRRNPSVARVASRKRDSIGHNQITAKAKELIPESYFASSTETNSDSLKWLISLDPNAARNLPKDNLLAAIQIDRTTGEGLLKLMILASEGKINAVSIEEQIKTQLQSDKIKYLKTGITSQDISFELASTIERELARSVIIPFMDLSRKEVTIGSKSKEAFKLALAFRSNVNDAVTARYLDGCIKELEEKMKSQGLDANKLKRDLLLEIRQEIESGLGVKSTSEFKGFINHNFFAGTNAALAAINLRKH